MSMISSCIKLFDHRNSKIMIDPMIGEIYLSEINRILKSENRMLAVERDDKCLKDALEKSDLLVAHLTGDQWGYLERFPCENPQIVVCVTTGDFSDNKHRLIRFGENVRLVLFTKDSKALKEPETLKEFFNLSLKQGKDIIDDNAEELPPCLHKVFGVYLKGEKWIGPLRMLCGGYLALQTIKKKDDDYVFDLKKFPFEENTEVVVTDLTPNFFGNADAQRRVERLDDRLEYVRTPKYWRIWEKTEKDKIIEALCTLGNSKSLTALIEAVESFGKMKEEDFTHVVERAYEALSALEA